MKNLRLNTQYIDYYLQKNNISKAEFCRRCGIKLSTLNNIYMQKNVNVDVIVRLAYFLNISTDTFMFHEKPHKKLIYNTQYIAAFMQRNNLTPQEFCKKCGISIKLLNNVFSQKENLNYIEIKPILEFLNITIDTFLMSVKR